VFNTIMNLTTQAAQVACFRNVSAHLEPGGCFVIEVTIPDLRRLPPGETFHVFSGSEAHWGIDEYDVATQGLISHHLEVIDGRMERFSVPFRYVWPSELDLMAEIAGMTCASAGRDGTESPSRTRAGRTCRSGRSPGPRWLTLIPPTALHAGSTTTRSAPTQGVDGLAPPRDRPSRGKMWRGCPTETPARSAAPDRRRLVAPVRGSASDLLPVLGGRRVRG
jgi:hypothetical protein